MSRYYRKQGKIPFLYNALKKGNRRARNANYVKTQQEIHFWNITDLYFKANLRANPFLLKEHSYPIKRSFILRRHGTARRYVALLFVLSFSHRYTVRALISLGNSANDNNASWTRDLRLPFYRKSKHATVSNRVSYLSLFRYCVYCSLLPWKGQQFPLKKGISL